MRTHCKLVAIAACLGVALLLYFLAGSGADHEGSRGDAREEEEEEEDGRTALPSKTSTKPAQKKARASPRGQRGQQGHQKQKQQQRVRHREGGAAVRDGAGGRAKPGLSRGRQRAEAGRGARGFDVPDERMHLAVVACGDRLDETLNMLKSALLFSFRKIKFHIFAEQTLASLFEKGLSQWPRPISSKFQYNIYPITFSVGNAEEWKKLFKPCAAQRLFLPVILKDVDSLLYVDTDVLFLSPVDHIWNFLKDFNSSQLAAMAPEHEIPKIGWYSRFARHPFYGVTGVNSGVMLMNLTRIRSTLFKNSMISGGLSWEDLLHPLYQKYKNHITWGDQDLLNIIFHYNPECLYIFPCQWNYRPDHCMYGSNCKSAEEEGVSILHGNRGVYHDDKQPAFKAVYDAIHDYPFEENLFQSLFYPLQTKFLDTVNTLCGRIPQVFLKQVEKTMRTVYERRVVRHMRPRHQ
ncbi:glucoside xylosyltransferase 2 isoform X2 [Scleropages formosus]|uniref:UDP-D-xylose:beta-D-glucoside alpha-1,3-D-xylosyltransferase n=1 Tax=Scleropages formosus TaxID=113540 RepID=A0A8C9V4Z8_SCLFO|nr:glucoside xylosyltransferase 2 isoform X2 [Scleropages formosus]